MVFLMRQFLNRLIDVRNVISLKLFRTMIVEKEVRCECVNRGMDINGEYDMESNMHCPNCDTVVGDYEYNELWYKHCPECAQKLKYTDIEE